MLIRENICQKEQEKQIKDFYFQKIKNNRAYKIKKTHLILIFKNKIRNNKDLIKK